MQGLIRRRGIPLARYTDRHAVFKHRSQYQPAGTTTQFGRAFEELGTQLIFARSPQAKGRVERTAGTLQDRLITHRLITDRLITELRLAGATTPLHRPRPCCSSSCPGSTGVSGSRPSAPSPHSGPWSRVFVWVRSCVSSTAGEWRGTIP